MLPAEKDEKGYKIAEGMYNLGRFLIEDDKFDVGHFAYRNRPHYYHGEFSKDHPSPLHHWIYGTLLIVGAEVMGTLLTLKQMRDGYIEGQSSASASASEENKL
jgi:hypothetical protein